MRGPTDRRTPAGILRSSFLFAAIAAALGSCGGEAGEGGSAPPGDAAAGETTAYVGASLFDGTGGEPIDEAVLLVRDGRVEAVGSASEVEVPDDARRVDLSGRHIVPGLVNAHGHVGGARGLESGPEVYTRETLLGQLARYARYGVTTVVSLGGDGPEGVRLRDEQATPDLDRARIFVAGPVLDPEGPGEVPALLDSLVALDVDWVKFRVDDFLGQAEKMAPEVYRALIEGGHARDLPVAVHIVELEDAKAVVRAGADLVAHSVRDRPVDEELIGLLREREVCVSPTLTRELSTFVYAHQPDFFDDPFFLAEVDSGTIRGLLDPDRQREVGESEAAAWYREHLPLAQENLRRLHDAGVGIAFGTDSGPPGRFQGYFEHVEMAMMAEAGLEPAEILRAATGGAARCMGLEEVGTLEEGKWADFVVSREDPLASVQNLRAIEGVWIAGNRVEGSRWPRDVVEEESS